MNEEKKLVPRLRFEEFSGPWEKRTLGDFGNVAMNKRIFKEQTTRKGDIPFYKIGTFGKEPDAFISRSLFEEYKSKYSYPKTGDILISASGSIGRTVEYKGKDEYFQDSNIVWLDHNGRIDNNYLKQFYNFIRWYGLEGSTIKRLYNSNILNTEIILPLLNEQEKIGDFFETFDEMIQLQQLKVKKVKDIKSAYLSEMFPKEGEKYPKRRFEGFTEPWEYHYLCEVTQIIMGQSPNSINYTNNPKDFILIQGNSDMKNGRVVPRIWTTQVTKKAHKGDLILSVRAPVGDIGKTDYDVVLGRGVAGIKGNEFIYQTFKNKKEQKYWDKLTTGSTFDSINSQDIKNLIIVLPSKEEQQKIGEFFKNLDTQITVEEEKLMKLEKLKQAYLNDMFV